MRRTPRLGLHALLTSALLLVAQGGSAQTLPGQTAPPSPAPGQSEQPGQLTRPGQQPADLPDLTGARDTAPLKWTYALGADEGYESDPSLTGKSGNDDALTRLLGSLGRIWTLKRGTIGASGTGSRTFYRGGVAPDQLDYGLALVAGYSVTHRLSWRASESLTSVVASDNTLLTASGLVFPRVQTKTNVMATGATYQASQALQVEVTASETGVLFPGAEFSNGSSFTLQGRVTRQAGRDQTIGFSVGNTFSSGTTGDVQGVLGLWQRTFGRGLTVHATGGVRPYTLFGQPGTKFAPGGSVAINKRLIRGQSFSGSYEYAVEQAFGFNRTHLANRFNFGYRQALGRRLVGEAGGSYGRNTYPEIPNYHLAGTTASLSLRYAISTHLSIGANYGFWSHVETAVPQSRNYRAGVSVSYGGAFR